MIAADGAARPVGSPSKLGSLDLLTDAEGRYRQAGLRAGNYMARATDPATGLQSPRPPGSLADGGELVLPDLRLPAVGSSRGPWCAPTPPRPPARASPWRSAGGRTRPAPKAPS